MKVTANVNHGFAPGDRVKMYRYRTRWQRVKLWVAIRILRRPDPDLYLISLIEYDGQYMDLSLKEIP